MVDTFCTYLRRGKEVRVTVSTSQTHMQNRFTDLSMAMNKEGRKYVDRARIFRYYTSICKTPIRL